MSIAHAADVLAFWRAAGAKKWFAKDDAFDADISARFLATYEAAARGELAAWEATPEGALALVIVLDQFPRNMFRGDARAFAADAVARARRRSRDRARIRRAGAERRAHVLLSAVRAFRERWPTRSAAARWYALWAMPTCCDGRSCMPTSSAASADFRIATPCSAGPPRRPSRLPRQRRLRRLICRSLKHTPKSLGPSPHPREGRGEGAEGPYIARTPSPQPSPLRGEGAHRLRSRSCATPNSTTSPAPR